MISPPIPAPRTREGKQVAKYVLGKVVSGTQVQNRPSVAMPSGTSCNSAMAAAEASPPPAKSFTCINSYQPTSQSSTPSMASGQTSKRNPDLNLTALISEVERDIWLLEQLENNSLAKRALQNPSELPFPVTEELLKLPGYKPGRNQQIIKTTGMYH